MKYKIFFIIMILIISISSVSATDEINIDDIKSPEISEDIIEYENLITSYSEINELMKPVNIQKNGTISLRNRNSDIIVTGQNFADIQSAINSASAGDRIILSGTYTGNSFINVDKPVEITSLSEATLDGENKFIRIFKIDASDVTLRNLNIINSQATAVVWDGVNGNLLNCTFINNKKRTGYGGAVEWNKKNGYVDNCIFINNSAVEAGGAIDWNPGDNLTLKNSKFINNTCHGFISPAAGAIRLYNANGNIINCTFIDNRAGKLGGALFLVNTLINMTDCTFYNNIAGQGGAIDFYSDSDCNKNIIQNCTFINNSAIRKSTFGVRGFGGAMIIQSSNNKIINCKFYDNLGRDWGGAICIINPNNLIDNCTFINNTGYYGGGITVYSVNPGYFAVNSTITNCNFINNTAGNSGGAFASMELNTTLSNSKFENNQAPYGGAIFFYRDTGYVDNCSFIKNSALTGNGGAAYLPNSITINNSYFTSNIAPFYGGAIYGTTINIFNSNLTNNSGSSAGAIYAQNTNIQNSKFENNSGSSAGAIYAQNTNIQNSKFENNTAIYDAGAIEIINGFLNIDNSSFINNDASYRGGAIFITKGATSKIYNTKLCNNTAELGGAIFLYNSTTLISKSNFTYNIAVNGSAIYNGYNSTTNVSHSSLLENQAHSYYLIVNSDENSAWGILIGGDNFINAIHTSEDELSVTITNVTNNNQTKKSNKEYLQNITITTYDKDGNILNTINKRLTDENGTVTYSFEELGYPYTVVFEHVEDNWYTQIRNETNLTYNTQVKSENCSGKINKTIQVPVNVLINGSNVDINASTVNISFNGINSTVNIVDGFINLTLPSIANIYELTINFAGKDNYNASSTKVNITVEKIPTEISLTNIVAYPTEEAVISILLTDYESKMINGTVNLYINGSSYGNINVINGQANYNYVIPSVSAQNITYTVYFNSTNDYLASNSTGTITIQPLSILNIVKRANITTCEFGDNVLWTIYVINTGYDDAENVIVNDLLPNGLTYINSSSTQGTYNPIEGSWNIGTLSNGKSVSLEIYTKINVANTTITNIANVISTTATLTDDGRINLNGTNKTIEANITVNEISKPDINKTSNNTGNASYGDLINFNITIKNNANGKITYEIIDYLPEGLIYINDTSSGIINNNIIRWNVTLDKNEIYVISITTKVNKSNTTLINRVSAINKTFNVKVDNSTNITVEPLEEINIVINKTPNNYFVQEGEIVCWTISIFNEGNGTAYNTLVKEKLDTDLEFINYTSTIGYYNKETGIWEVNILKPNEQAILKIYTRVLKTSRRNILNQAIVNYTDIEGRNYTNSQGNILTVIHPNISIDKKSSNPIVYLGNQTEFIITVTNTGDYILKNVFVIEFSHDGLTYDSFIGNKWTKIGNMFVYNDILEVGKSASFSIIFNTTKTGILTNIIIAGSNITQNKTTNSSIEVIEWNKTDPNNKTEDHKNELKAITISENTGNPILALLLILLLIPITRLKK